MPRLRCVPDLTAPHESMPTGQSAPTIGTTGGGTATSLVPDSSGPVVQLQKVFPYQSYFSSTLLEKAILPQFTNEPIVRASRDDQIGVSGFAAQLHPSSETPVAVQFITGSQQGESATVILKPGQYIRPSNGSFSGLRWGLPFGWLGGGVATLLVFRAPVAEGNAVPLDEIVFHRGRYAIIADANPFVAANANWPTRFPWPNAVQGAGATSQAGSPAFQVKPSRITMSLVLNTLVAPAKMRMAFTGTSFDLANVDGTTVTAQNRYIDVQWPAKEGTSLAYPIIDLDNGPIIAMGGDGAKMTLLDLDGALTGQFVDIIRWGRM